MNKLDEIYPKVALEVSHDKDVDDAVDEVVAGAEILGKVGHVGTMRARRLMLMDISSLILRVGFCAPKLLQVPVAV